MMKRHFALVAVVMCLGLSSWCHSARAAVSECDYSKTYDNPQTIYVSRDGSGDFNCDGTNDEVEINQAFETVKNSGGAYTSVFLKSGTYVIGSQVNMVSGSILEGDKDAVLKLKDQANWTVNVPMIGSLESAPSNIEIKCFEIDGNYAGNYSEDAYSCMAGGKTCAKDDYACCEAFSPYRTTGKGYYTLAYFLKGANYSMHDMYVHDALNDAFKIMYGSNVKFYDNRVYKMGHEGMYVMYSNGVEAYGNTITNRTNSGVRTDNTNHVSIHNNDIQAFDHWSAGGPGIEIVKDKRSTIPVNDVEIYDNVIHGTYGPGIWITASGVYGSGDTAARIHHNVFYGTGINPTINWTAGILTAGFYNLTIENNVFDRVYNGALVVSNAVAAAPSGLGYVTNFRNNIVRGTQPLRNTTTNGYGILNLLSATHKVDSANNVYFDNYAGNYSGMVTRSEDINADPLFADAENHDYHLQSSHGRWNGSAWVNDAADSPAIDAGYVASDYSLEPAPNGGRINAGRYGNTGEASKSPQTETTYLLTVNGGSGTGDYPAGAAITIQADEPPAGKVFDQWTGDTAYVSDIYASNATVTMPAGNVNLTAAYKDEAVTLYSLTISGGSGSGSYAAGTQVTITADAPVEGKTFDQWTGDTAYVSDLNAATATVTMPDKPITLTATYKTAYYLAISGGSGSGWYTAGTKVTIAANAPEAGKVFYKWTGDIRYLSSIYFSTTTVTMPSKNISLTATYRTKYLR
jgi:hypothetical protein